MAMLEHNHCVKKDKSFLMSRKTKDSPQQVTNRGSMVMIPKAKVWSLQWKTPTKISKCCGNPRECNKAAAHYPQKAILRMLPSIETMLDKMYGFRRGLLQGKLNAKLICAAIFSLEHLMQFPLYVIGFSL